MKDRDLREKFDNHMRYEFAGKVDDIARNIFNDFKKSLKECKTCGCLLLSHAIKGKPEIKQRPVLRYHDPKATEDFIYTPYYCRVHAPKNK